MYELKLSLAPSFITKTESQVSDRTEQNRTEQNLFIAYTVQQHRSVLPLLTRLHSWAT